MSDGKGREELRRYLDPKVLVKISRLDLIARLVVEGFVSGLHKSPYHGFSVEFAQHREYVPGDDIRHIDWKVYGRSDRYYIKQYEEETNLKAHILLDTSESMRFRSGDLSKLEYGCFVAASLAHLILNQQDSVGLILFDREIARDIPPSSHPSHRNVILKALNDIKSRKKTDLGGVFHQMAEHIRRKGLIVVISDLFDDPETPGMVACDAKRILTGLRHFRHRRHEVVLFHVLDRQEVDFPFDRMTRFLDMEGPGKALVDPRSLRQAYLEEIGAFTDDIKRGCRQDRIDYVPLTTDRPLDVALASYLATRADMKLS